MKHMRKKREREAEIMRQNLMDHQNSLAANGANVQYVQPGMMYQQPGQAVAYQAVPQQ